MWFIKDGYDYKKHYGKKTIIQSKYYFKTITGNLHSITVSPIDSRAITVVITNMQPTIGFKLHKHSITSDLIDEMIIDETEELHKKYTFCRNRLLEKLPEEIVKKEIFSFLKTNYIEI